MNPIPMLSRVPLADLLIIAALVLGLILVVRLVLRRSKFVTDTITTSQPPPTPHGKLRHAGYYVLRLAGFALLSLLIIGGAIMFYEVYQGVSREIAPTPSRVETPADLSFQVEEVSFEGGDSLAMAGWFVPPRNSATIILLHGYGGNRLGTVWYAENLIKAGYGVLMYDERASGESQGEQRSYGWFDAADVGGALAYLESRPEVNPGRIGIAGCSIGGQISLQGAANYPQIRAVWADGPAVIRAIDNPTPSNWATVLAYTANFMTDWVYTWRLGVDAPPAMIEIISRIAPRPVMLVGGGTARPYLVSEAPRLWRYAGYAGTNAEVWIIDEATHCDGPERRPQEYAGRLVAFFDRAFDRE